MRSRILDKESVFKQAQREVSIRKVPVSILAQSHSDWSSYTDGDASALPILDLAFDETFEQDSAEFRFTWQTGGRFDHIAELYFLESRLENQQGNIFEPTFTMAPGTYGFDHVYTASSFQRETKLFSMFASGSYHLDDRWHFT